MPGAVKIKILFLGFTARHTRFVAPQKPMKSHIRGVRHEESLALRAVAPTLRGMPTQTNKRASLEPKTEDEWRDHIKGIIKSELKRQNLTYADLARRLQSDGVEETEASIRNKVSRGSFSAVFLFQCMAAIGVQVIAFRQDYVWNIAAMSELSERFKSS